MCGDSCCGCQQKNPPAAVILTLYGRPAQWGLVQPHSFAVFHSAFRPGAVGSAAVSPGRKEDVF